MTDKGDMNWKVEDSWFGQRIMLTGEFVSEWFPWLAAIFIACSLILLFFGIYSYGGWPSQPLFGISCMLMSVYPLFVTANLFQQKIYHRIIKEKDAQIRRLAEAGKARE